MSGQWAVAVLEGLHFASTPARFRELQRRIEATDGKRIHYSLTDRGHALLNLVDHLGRWRSPAPGAGGLPCKPQWCR